ncbi:hypothetical protein J7L67_05825, partial [bacterium]|nr:hypothetical protein [bacterium]
NNKLADILEEFNLTLNELTYKNITLTSTDINGNLSRPDMVYSGGIFAEKLSYEKIDFLDMMSKFNYSDNILNLNIKNAIFAGGRMKGAITIDLKKSPVSYQGDLFFKNLGSSDLMVIFGMDKKMDMSGKWNGEIHFSGILYKIDNITGFLTADKRGGELIIKDKAMVEKIMSGVQSADEKISESLSHHDYKQGNMSIGLDNNSIKINLSLSGDTGNRKFDIYLHDFLFN